MSLPQDAIITFTKPFNKSGPHGPWCLSSGNYHTYTHLITLRRHNYTHQNLMNTLAHVLLCREPATRLGVWKNPGHPIWTQKDRIPYKDLKTGPPPPAISRKFRMVSGLLQTVPFPAKAACSPAGRPSATASVDFENRLDTALAMDRMPELCHRLEAVLR